MEDRDSQGMHMKQHISQAVEEMVDKMMEEDRSDCVCVSVSVSACLRFKVESRIYI